MAPNDTIKIAIAGGGIAGLALAAGLHKKHPHIDYHIYEAVPEYKDVGAGLALHMNAIKAMTLIHPDVRKAYFDNASDMGEEEQEMSTEVILAQGPNMGELVAELGEVFLCKQMIQLWLTTFGNNQARRRAERLYRGQICWLDY